MPLDITFPNANEVFGGYKTPADVFPQIPQYDPFGLKATGQGISDFFSNGFKNLVSSLTPKSSVITDTSTQTVRTNLPLRTIAASAGVVGTGITVYATATNPDLNKTLQTNSSALATIAEALNNTSKAGLGIANFFTSSPYGPVILIGGLALLGIVLLKKWAWQIQALQMVLAEH